MRDGATMKLGFERDAIAPFSPSNCSPSRFHLDLFSGIGGFALAARWTGWKTIGFSEIEPYACKVLAKNFPGIPNLGDIRTVRGIPCDLITGGFPCQPYSVAGKRAGASDDRALWPEMLRVIAESKPRWVLGENVPGIISLELDRVLSDLENIGYSAWPLVIPACAVDARHRRDRLWLVAHTECSDGRQGCAERSGEAGAGARHESARPSKDVADADQGRIRRAGTSGRERHAAQRGQNVAQPNGARSEARLSAPGHRKEGHAAIADNDSGGCCRWPDEATWFFESGMGRVAHGIPNRAHRLKGLGNAIVPQVAETLLRMMARMENAPDQRPAK